MLDIEKMQQAALAATQGEWVVSDHIYASDGKRVASYHMISRDDRENEANATHIATANPSAVLELIAKYKALESELETERLRLAACGVAALGYFNGCKDEYRSASLEDTLRLYDSNKELTSQLAEYKADADRYRHAKRIAEGISHRGKLRAFYMPEDLEDILEAMKGKPL